MIERALIVKKKWLDLILSGEKTWEIRGHNTKIRGRIGLVEYGSGLVVGQCEIIDSFPANAKNGYVEGLTHNAVHKHGIMDWKSTVKYNNPHVWVIKNAKRYKRPCPYVHPKGAVIWVKI